MSNSFFQVLSTLTQFTIPIGGLHSAGSSAQCTRFVITFLFNRTSSQIQNSTALVLENDNGGRNTCSNFTEKMYITFVQAATYFNVNNIYLSIV